MIRDTWVSLTKLSHDDLIAIERIERLSYSTPWSRRMFESELKKPTSICVGAFQQKPLSRLVGYLIASRYVDTWHIMNVAVDPQYRRRGIARCLLEEILALTSDVEMCGHTLEVRVSNSGAIRLYEEFGFVTRGLRHGYYIDNREDALVMWRDSLCVDRVRV